MFPVWRQQNNYEEALENLTVCQVDDILKSGTGVNSLCILKTK